MEDTPFIAVEVTWREREGIRQYWFRTNMDEVVPLDRQHPLDSRVNPFSGSPSPIVMVRDGLAARLARPVYYELAEHVDEHPPGSGIYGVSSGGCFFALT